MIKQSDLDAKIRKGEHAERLINDPLVKEVLENMRNTVYNNIRTSHYKDREDREDLYKSLKAIDAFETEFKQMINGGKKAKKTLKDLFYKR